MNEGMDVRRSDLLGVLLAGGRSFRFGSPKAIAPVGGRMMAEWGLEALDAVVERVVVIANDPIIVESLGRESRPDRRPDSGEGLPTGPVAGIETALEWAAELGLSGAVVLGCDMPRVRAPIVRAVVDAWPGSGVAVARSDGPLGCEPLCGVYGVDRLSTVKQFLDRGFRSMGALMRAPGPAILVDVPMEDDPFLNVNQPDDVERT